MWLLDQWAERHIRDAQTKGEFDNQPVAVNPLVLEDDSHIPLNYGWISLTEKMRGVCLPSLNSARGD